MTQAAPYTWTKASLLFLEILRQFIDKSFNILEMGSSTGHISFKMALGGYKVTLLDIRENAINEARQKFQAFNLKTQFFCEDIFLHHFKYDFVWNSGLIQCFKDNKKLQLLQHVVKLTDRLLLFYPDTDNPAKKKGINCNETPGVKDAVEYSVKNVPLLFSSVYKKVFFGRILGTTIEMPFDMLWIYGRT